MLEEKLARYKRIKKIILTVVLAAVIFLAIAVTLFFTVYISDYSVEGNVYVEEQQIQDEIFGSPMEQRFFYAVFRNLLGLNKKVEYLASYSLNFRLDLSVDIEVTENAVVGAVSWQGEYYYFDQNGYVMKASVSAADNVPVIEGLNFDQIELYKKLDPKQSIDAESMLTLTQLLSAYEISVDSIAYDENSDAIITVGTIKVNFGSDESMEGKISEFKSILAGGGLEGLTGTLHLENYSANSSNSSFIFDRE